MEQGTGKIENGLAELWEDLHRHWSGTASENFHRDAALPMQAAAARFDGALEGFEEAEARLYAALNALVAEIEQV